MHQASLLQGSAPGDLGQPSRELRAIVKDKGGCVLLHGEGLVLHSCAGAWLLF